MNNEQLAMSNEQLAIFPMVGYAVVDYIVTSYWLLLLKLKNQRNRLKPLL